MSDYPIPRYAASVWLAGGDTLWLAFPPLAIGQHGHSVPFKVDLPALRALAEDHRELRGLVLALETLKERGETGASTIGTRSAPVRYDIERAMAEDERYRSWLGAIAKTKKEKAAEKIEAEGFLKEIGL